MKMIMLQRMNRDATVNLGGLYVAVDKICEIYYNKVLVKAVLVTSSGKSYVLANPLREVLDELTRANKESN